MNQLFKLSIATVFATIALSAPYSGATEADNNQEPTWMDEFDPRDPNAEKLLEEFDKIQEQETGMPSWLNKFGDGMFSLFKVEMPSCYQDNCNVFARVSKRNQKLYLSVSGKVEYAWAVSTGMEDFETPDMNRHPSGRIYDRYSSSKYPGGDYKGLGNMPYAVFIRGGYAIHGTPQANWGQLGRPASHGCIRLHPDNAKVFNRLVRANGVAGSWITVED